jgi:predicted site-specific integrase-resolvase
MAEELLNYRQTAHRLGVSYPTITNWVGRGLLATTVVAERRVIIGSRLPTVERIRPTRYKLTFPDREVEV